MNSISGNKLKFPIFFLLISMLSMPINLFGNGFKVLHSDNNRLVISFKPDFKKFEEINNDNYTFSIPKFSNAYYDSENIGAPMTFTTKHSFSVPNANAFTIEDIKVKGMASYSKMMAPVPSRGDNIMPSSKDYVRDANQYSSDASSKWASATYAGLCRSKHLAHINFVAARYNSNNNSIEIPQEIIATVRFNNSAKKSLSKKDNFNYDFVLNANDNDWAYTAEDTQIKPIKGSSISSGKWIRLRITQQGIYSISKQDLVKLNAIISPSELNTVKIFGHGGMEIKEKLSASGFENLHEQAIVLNKDGSNDLSSIVFYAGAPSGFHVNSLTGVEEHYINHYGNHTDYLLTWGGDKGKRAKAINIATAATRKPKTYIHQIFFEEDKIHPYSKGSGRQWFGDILSSSAYTNTLHGLDRSGTIEYKFSIAHKANSVATLNFFENNNYILSDRYLSNVSSHKTEAKRLRITGTVDANKVSADNVSKIRITYVNQQSAGANGFLDYYEIFYPRFLQANDGNISITTELDKPGIAEYKVSNFSSNNIYGFDVSNSADPKLLLNIAQGNNSFTFKSEETSTLSKYYIASKFKKPVMSNITLAGLRWDLSGADAILVTHPALIESAKAFKVYREKHSNISVKLVLTDDIYKEFSYGTVDPSGIRNFVAHATHFWEKKPNFLILWGDGHYDFKQIATNKINYIPAFEDLDDTDLFSDDDSQTYEDYYSWVVGDDEIADICLGRLTIDSPEEGFVILNKIKHYEQSSAKGDWRSRILLIADDGPQESNISDGSVHVDQSETLANSFIPNDFELKKIYLSEYATENIPGGRSKPKATSDMINEINNRGALVLNWIGHGNPRVWAHENLLTKESTIPKFTNKDKLTFITAATCEFGRFDNPNVKSGAEELMLNPNGGAIGIMSAPRIVYINENEVMDCTFSKNLLDRNSETGKYPTIGEAYMKTKQKLYDYNSKRFFLLGDPTLRLLIPEYKIKISSINGTNIDKLDTPLQIKALSEVVIKGYVEDAQGVRKNNYVGTAMLKMFDGDIKSEYKDKNDIINPDNIFSVLKYGGALSKVSTKIQNGSFEFKFVIPKDISYSDSLGRIFISAFSDNMPSAKGFIDRFFVKGINSSSVVDKKGPEINIFIDSRQFKSGDLVRTKPLLMVDLFDDTAINSTGIGIGHRLEAWIDDNPIPIDLTDKYNSSPDDSRFGVAMDYLENLEAGLHKIKVRAWDIYNNYSMSNSLFKINNNTGSYTIAKVENYPNPFSANTNIRFLHDLSPPFEAELSVYTIEGNLIFTNAQTITTAHSSEIEWDGKNSLGQDPSQGVYILRIKLVDKQGKTVIKSGRATRIKE